jgi:hypothetical protein
MADTNAMLAMASAITSETSVDDIAEVINAINFVAQAAKEARRLFESAMEQRIRETGQEIVVGDIRYYLGTEKKTTCKNPSATIRAILEAAGGDEDRLIQCLSANWVKPGTTRKMFEEFGCPDQFDALFDVQIRSELKEGKPVKKLLSVNTKFVPSKGV